MLKIAFMVGVVSLFFGSFVGFYIAKSISKADNASDCSEKYTFLNDQLDCSQKVVIEKKEYGDLGENIRQLIDRQTASDSVSLVAVYFRDLVQGPTLGINEHSKFIPASLLKVPLMLTFFRLAETNPSILSEKTSYSSSISKIDQSDDLVPSIAPHTQYTISELIQRMIISSDNISYDLLLSYLTENHEEEDLVKNTLTELGLINPRNSTDNSFSVKSYASIFRQLFNGSYLTPEYSEKALAILSQAEFNKGLAAGVPPGIKIAHKFGERGGLPDNGMQFHDCGIVYFPQNPYLLCIMTRGKNLDRQIEIVKDISNMVYREVESRRIE